MWTYTISQNSLYGASYLKRPVGDPNEFKFTTVVELTLDSSDVIQVTLIIGEPASGSAISIFTLNSPSFYLIKIIKKVYIIIIIIKIE